MLTFEQKIQLLRRAKELSYRWWVDQLRVGEARREKIEMDFEEALSKFDNSCHFSINYRGYDIPINIEIVFCTMNVRDTDYILWIQIEPKKINQLFI